MSRNKNSSLDTMESSMEVPQKTELSYNPAIPLMCISSKEMKPT